MRDRSMHPFWFGFVATAAALLVVWYWFEQQRQLRDEADIILDPIRPNPEKLVSKADVVGAVTDEVAAVLSTMELSGRPIEAGNSGSVEEDNLQQITGIGKVYAGRLKAAGIRTFQQLAQQKPERIAEIVQLRSWQAASPAEWIEAAGRLIS